MFRLAGQITLVVLVLLTSRATLADPPITVALELGGLDSETYDQLDGLALEKRVVLRLVQEGFAAVSPKAQPTILISLVKTAEGLVLEADSNGQHRSRPIPRGNEPLAAL